MTGETTLWVALASLVTSIVGFAGTWFQASRARTWQKEDAEKLAKKLADDTKEMAQKVNADAADLAAKVNQEAAVMAAKVIADAEKIAIKVHESAEKLANKVAENTTVSTDAARGAKEAYTEANTINSKIAALQESLIKVTTHIEQKSIQEAANAKAMHDEVMFNQRVKVAIEEALAGHPKKSHK